MSGIAAAVRAPVSGWAWRATMHAVAGMVLGLKSLLVLAVLVPLAVLLMPLALAGVPVLGVALLAARGIALVDSARHLVYLDLRVPLRGRPIAAGGPLARLWRVVTWSGSWIELGYGLVLLPASALLHGVVVLAVWGAAGAFTLFPLYGWMLPAGGVIGSWSAGLVVSSILHVLAGLALLLLAPWVARGSARGASGLARTVLAPSEREALEDRVETLTETRSRMVDAADAERRRIERDLHDGAQQRLVAVAMTLGRARARLDDDPPAARALVEEAHSDVKQALTELRDLARGLHPAVLTDRGLDAAVSALAARSPVPVAVEVDAGPRPGAAVEAVAYFVVAEALTNVAKHARARKAWVRIRRHGPLLALEVGDDGVGGADAGFGTGLAGLRDRVRAVDGALRLSSPPGGPTRIEVDLPCAS